MLEKLILEHNNEHMLVIMVVELMCEGNEVRVCVLLRVCSVRVREFVCMIKG